MDYEPTLATEHLPALLQMGFPSETNPIHTDVTINPVIINRMTADLTTPHLGKMEKDVLNFEVWHQRFAHCSEKRRRVVG